MIQKHLQRSKNDPQRPKVTQIKFTATHNDPKQYNKSSQRSTTTDNIPEKFITTDSDPKQSTIIHKN